MRKLAGPASDYTYAPPLLALLIAASLGFVCQSPTALAIEITFDTAPPAARHEVVPPPRKGYVWVPGYWDGAKGKHSWKNGHWEPNRAGQHFVEPRWVQRDHRWALEPGRWNPGDRDGDGVPNSLDRQADNPARR